MKTREFNIGDEVWTLRAIQKCTEVVCPDCAGNKYLTVIMGDGSQETIDCDRCERGWQGCQGVLYDQSPDWLVITARVTRKEQKSDGAIEYGCDEYHYTPHVYETEEEAGRAREEAIAVQEAEFLAKLRGKEYCKKSWAWHVHYHRREIKNLTKRIEYHQAKLDVAKLKSKDKES